VTRLIRMYRETGNDRSEAVWAAAVCQEIRTFAMHTLKNAMGITGFMAGEIIRDLNERTKLLRIQPLTGEPIGILSKESTGRISKSWGHSLLTRSINCMLVTQ
jgi:hypothetical protein